MDSETWEVKLHDDVASLSQCGSQKRSGALIVLLAVRTAMTQEDVDMVAGDFNIACRRRKTGPEQQYDSTLQEAFKKRQAPGAHGLPTVVGPW